MIKPKFNLFLYSKNVFGLTRNNEKVQSVSVESNDYHAEILKVQTAFRKYVDTQKSLIRASLEKVEIRLESSAGKANARANAIVEKIHKNMESGYDRFKTFLNSLALKNAKPEDRKKMIEEKILKMKQVFKKYQAEIREFIEAEKEREKLIRALKKQKQAVKAYFKKFFSEKLTSEQQKKVVWSDLSTLIDAYMDRWVNENERVINNLSTKRVKLLYSTLGNGIFARGILKKDVEEIKGQIHIIIKDYWLEGREREVYKKSNWTDLWRRSDGLVPFPDGENFAPPKGKKPYISPLEEKYLAGMEKKEKKEMNAVLAQRSRLIATFKSKGGIEEEFNPWIVSLRKLAKQSGYPQKYITEFILQPWGETEKKLQYLPIMKKETEILKAAIEARKEFDTVVKERARLVKELKEKHVTTEEIKASQLFTSNGFKLNKLDIFLKPWVINMHNLLYFGSVKKLTEQVKNENKLFEDVLKEVIKDYKISPEVILNGSELQISINQPNIPKFVQDRISKEFQQLFSFDFMSKYADINSEGKLDFKKLLLNKLKSSKLFGRVTVENPSITIKAEPKQATVVGYASFDSSGYNYKTNYEKYALGRAKKLGIKGAKLIGQVIGVNKDGKSIVVRNKEDVQKSWQNVIGLYNKLARKKRLESVDENKIRALLAKYNNKDSGITKWQKDFFYKYFGRWRKTEVKLATTKDSKFKVNVRFATPTATS